MDQTLSSPDSVADGQMKKRKWSPHGSNPEVLIGEGGALSRSPARTLPGSPAKEESHDGSGLGYKRVRLESHILDPEDSVRQTEHDSDVSRNVLQLPPEIWQLIFTFVPPVSLGRLLRVSLAFNKLIAPGSELPRAEDPLLDQDYIWSLSRKNFIPGMPRPLSGVSELAMWQLLRTDPCQFCGKMGTSKTQTVPLASWNSGPGLEGVRIIWPFAVRSCGACLTARIMKETELLFSSTSALMPALPFAFFTPSLNFVPNATMRTTQPPQGLQLTKYYFRPQVDQIEIEMEDVKALGFAAAEEWHKGLQGRGKDKLTDSIRWEQWDASGELQTILNSRCPIPSVTQSMQADAVSSLGSPPTSVTRSSSQSNGHSRTVTPNNRPAAQGSLQSLPPKPATPAPGHQSAAALPSYQSVHMPIQPHVPQPRAERSIRDVHQMKLDRRSEIERRCLALDPPIMPSTLVYMDSFAAATQIPMALNEGSWELLKSRLLAQREVAEEREREQQVANQHLQAKAEERRHQEAQLNQARELLEREWEETQKPVRDMLNKYAEDFIQRHWDGGNLVNYENCPQFGADVLMHVRKTFFETLAHEDTTRMERGLPLRLGSPNGSTRKLTLENMKWVFEAKIKPLTEGYRKDIFLCSVCDNPSKFYVMDAVIQHYAAKHTSALSLGTAVVYWKAEWPEVPPFDPHPNAAKLMTHNPAFTGMSSLSSYHGVDSMPVGVMQHPGSHQTQFFGPDRRAGQQMSPPRTFSQLHQHHQGPMYQQQFGAQSPAHYPVSVDSFSHGHRSTSFYPTSRKSVDHYPPPLSPAFSPYQPFPQPPTYMDPVIRPGSTSSHHPHFTPSHGAWTPYHSTQAATSGNRQLPIGPGQPFGIYQVQIEELARIAREIWDRTSGIKGLPSTVRLKVIIHHVVLRFAEKFTNEPNLTLFADSLNNNSQMKPMRTVDDLDCKACMASEDQPTLYQQNTHPGSQKTKSFTLPELLSHFQAAHVERAPPRMIPQTSLELPRLDWKFDMIELPADAVITNLMYAPGIDFGKLGLIATVLPKYFPSPLPKFEPVPDPDETILELIDTRSVISNSQNRKTNEIEAATHKQIDSVTPLHKLPPRPEGLEVAVENFPKFLDSPMYDSRKGFEPVGEDEYDPHRPAPAYTSPLHQSSRTGGRSESSSHYETNTSFHSHLENTQTAGVNANSSYRPTAPSSQFPPHADTHRARHPLQPRYPSHDITDLQRPIIQDRQQERTVPSQGSDLLQESFYRSQQDRDLARPDDKAIDLQIVGDLKIDSGVESMNAAEQFLNSFDPTETDAFKDIGNANVLPANVGPEEQPATDRQGLMPLDAISEKRKWRPEIAEDVIPGASTRGTPSVGVPMNGLRRRSRSPISSRASERHREDEYDPRRPQSGVAPLEKVHAVPMPNLRDQQFDPEESRYPEVLPMRREAGRPEDYDHHQYVSRQVQARPASELEPLPVFYREHSPRSRYQPRDVYPPPSPELIRRQYPAEEPIRFAGGLPPRQYRYIDEQRYIEPGYGEAVEYIRVAPRDVSGRFYIERPGPHEEYVGYERNEYRREPVFERNGQLYTRAPPPQQPPDMYQDPYGRQIRYQ